MQYWKDFLVASCLALVAGAATPALQDEPAKAQVEKAADDKADKLEKRPATSKELFVRFAKMKGLEASFTEKKYLALLAVPLESKGKLYFLPTEYLTRVVESPAKSTLSITPKELRMSDSNGDEVMDLRQNPEVRAFVSSLVFVFSGDSQSLAKFYKVEYKLDEKDEAAWSLTLTPLKKPLTEMVRSLYLEGTLSAVDKITIFEPNGDRAVTLINEADPKRVFTDKEKLKLFGIEKAGPNEPAVPASEGERAK
jgi:hypothetical protein